MVLSDLEIAFHSKDPSACAAVLVIFNDGHPFATRHLALVACRNPKIQSGKASLPTPPPRYPPLRKNDPERAKFACEKPNPVR